MLIFIYFYFIFLEYVSTLVGNKYANGNTDGPFSSAIFNQILAMTYSNNSFYLGSSASAIRKVSLIEKTVTTISGYPYDYSQKIQGPGSVASFGAWSIAIVSDNNGGNLVSDNADNMIKYVNASGYTTNLYGDGNGQTANGYFGSSSFTSN